MTTAISRCAIVAATAGTLVLATLPAAHGTPAADHSKPKVGNRCLIGTWHDNSSVTSTRLAGKTVKLRYGGGDVDHIFAGGTDHNSWQHSKASVGSYKGHKVREKIRGRNRLHMKAIGHHRLRVTEKGWSKGSRITYTYRGHTTKGSLPQSGHSVRRFRCTAKKLTFLSKHGKVVSTETRLSRKP